MRSRSPLTGEEDLSGGRPGGCQGLSGGGGTLSANLADRLGLVYGIRTGESGGNSATARGLAGSLGMACWCHSKGGSLRLVPKDWSGMTSWWKGISRFSSHSIAGKTGL